MPTNSPIYGLHLYNNTTDKSQLFSNFRANLDGTSASSNMMIIETALNKFKVQSQTIILIGDSITSLCGPGPDTLDGSSDVQNARGFFQWANFYLDQRFKIVKIQGVGGETTASILARFATDVLAYSSDWVCIQGGTNDLVNARTAAAIESDLLSMINLAHGNNRLVLLPTIPPRDIYTAPEQVILFEVNEWIRQQGLMQAGVVVADVWATYADPTNGQPIAAFTVDGVHPSMHAAERWGYCIAQALMNCTNPVPPRQTWSDAGDANCVFGLANLLTTVGWTNDGVTSFAELARDRSAQGSLIITLTGLSGGGDNIYASEDISAGRFAPGDIVQASVHVKWDNIVAYDTAQVEHLPILGIRMRNADDSFEPIVIYGMLTGSAFETHPDVTLLPANGEGTLLTARMTITTNVTLLYIYLGWLGAVSGTVIFTDLAVWKE